MAIREDDDRMQALTQSIEELRLAVERDTQARQSWRLALRTGAIAAAGGVLGTTVALAILSHFLAPLQNINALKPSIDRLDHELQHRR